MNNLTIFQFFHWYYSTEGNLWQHAIEKANYLSGIGITHVWLPPAYKSAYGTTEPGYAVYDLFDLGEFDQKGTVRTRYGTRAEYEECIRALHKEGIQVIADIVLNHKHGADEQETIHVWQVHPENRNEILSEAKTIDAWTKFTFPGRQGKYSNFVWDFHAFTGISENPEHIYLIENEYTNGQWDEMLEDEQGNYDYLMGADIEFRNQAVREELKYWGEWYMRNTGVDALRLDAVKHISHNFFVEWLDHLKHQLKKDFLCIGEYWRSDVDPLLKYIDATGGRIQLFDVPLHFNFYEASMADNQYDMRKLLDNSLVQRLPLLAVTFVDNHDTQPLQSLQSTVEYWFKPLAYAIILLREQGLPCVFYPAMFEAKYIDVKDNEEVYVELNTVPHLENMIKVRKLFAYGQQHDYFDHNNTIGWTRVGAAEKEASGCAVLMTNGLAGNKKMEIGKQHTGKVFVDICGCEQRVTIDEDGCGEFYVGERSVSVWLAEDALKLLQ
jgi:alpha-amylase